MIRTCKVSSISQPIPPVEGFVPIPILSWHKRDSKYHVFSPYYLKTDAHEEHQNPGGVIFENFWQGSKVYPVAPAIQAYTSMYTQGNPKYLLWENPSDIVCLNRTDDIMLGYFAWRNSLWACKNAIRYPVGYNKRTSCRFSLMCTHDGNIHKLGYIESRKRIYLQEYKRLVRQLPEYKELLQLLRTRQNICLYEIDVPAFGKKGEHGKNINKDGSYDVTPERIQLLLNDDKSAFGHGLCLADALLEDF